MKCSALLAVLCAYFLVARVSPPSLSPTSEPFCNIRLAPEVTAVSLQELVCSNWKPGHLFLRPTGSRPSLFSSILLLIAGDVQVNPGPAKHPCASCSKPVKSNQRGIFCEVCYQWYHTKCVNMCTSEYQRLSDEGWCCHRCHKESFPSMTAPILLLPLIRLSCRLAPPSPKAHPRVAIAWSTTLIAAVWHLKLITYVLLLSLSPPQLSPCVRPGLMSLSLTRPCSFQTFT